jgi:hypothetical protein
MQPGGGFLPSIAARNAATVSRASMVRPIAYPITRRDQASRMRCGSGL